MGGASDPLNARTTELLEDLIERGVVPDPERARRRLKLGYPFWLVLEDLGPEQVVSVLSEATGIPPLEFPLRAEHLDIGAIRAREPEVFKARRWAPLVGGEVAIADPFGPLPDGDLAGRPVRLAPAREIDAALGTAFPVHEEEKMRFRRLGRLLLDEGVITEEDLLLALDEQARSGGRLGEILLAHDAVDAPTLSSVLARRLGLSAAGPSETPQPLLPADLARRWQAVALENPGGEAVPVVFADPSPEAVEAIQEYLGRSVEPRIADAETVAALSSSLYAEDDVEAVVTGLLEEVPHFSAFGNRLSAFQIVVGIALLVLAAGAIFVAPVMTAVVLVAVGTLLYVAYGTYRMYTAWQGWRAGSAIRPSREELQSLDERELPVYTLLLPVYKEKPSTMRALFDALSRLDYPKHKLDGILLVEEDDDQTLAAVEEVGKPGWLRSLPVPEAPGGSPAKKVGRPGWLRVLKVPPGEPRTKPKAMLYGLLYARGELITIYDAEDQPDPHQLKGAVWGFRHSGEEVACIQAKLNYYNPRQNLLTRWFSLEYSAWFDMFLPGLHRLGAPIPLGGTSNHFRAEVLKQSMSWDPYNVTEDADLGLRLARMGRTTRMLDSTTYEEANSRLKNWIRQRSRWIKGYMQTFLVHTRHPLRLWREIGLKNTLHFLATVGGLIYTVIVSPVFWLLLVLWLLLRPGWIPMLFPGPVYYLALASLFVGNFFFVFLGLIGAVGRGNDDLAPYTLLIPLYWLLMSVAGYMALYELIVRPSYWQKTEHGLHFEEQSGASLQGGQ